MIEIYATVVGVLQYAFPPIYATVVRSQGILLFRLQALRKVLYGIRKYCFLPCSAVQRSHAHA